MVFFGHFYCNYSLNSDKICNTLLSWLIAGLEPGKTLKEKCKKSFNDFHIKATLVNQCNVAPNM